jgi:hypothetical protein
MSISKGVPQGYNLGTIIFNIFINDIFFFIKTASVYNYADDNTLSYFDTNIDSLQSILENESLSMI